jgi:ADP-ribosyl-[dinitrogen reductase] hydrolase
MKKLNLKKRIKGAVFAHACGDYLGMPVEFFSNSEKVKTFFGEKGIRPMEVNSRGIKPAGYYTDDTAMMLCLANSILEKGWDTKHQFTLYKKWAFEGYMSADNKTAFGIGQNTLRKLMWQKPEDIPTEVNNNEKEGGNGALMRCLPVGLIYHNDIDEIVKKSFESALVTHNNEVAFWSTVVFNTLISYALHDIEKEECINRIKKEEFFEKLPLDIKKCILEFKNKKKEELNTSGYSANTFEIVLFCFLNTENLEEAIKDAISLGGDTDTQAAIVGGLAGAYYGFDDIPEDWVINLQNRDLIEGIADRIVEITPFS